MAVFQLNEIKPLSWFFLDWQYSTIDNIPRLTIFLDWQYSSIDNIPPFSIFLDWQYSAIENIPYSQTDNSLLSGVDRGNYQNGQNYGIMELSDTGWCASGKAIYITGPVFFYLFIFNISPLLTLLHMKIYFYRTHVHMLITRPSHPSVTYV